jgi:plastocyanin
MKKILILLTFALYTGVASSTIVTVVSSGFTFSPSTVTVNPGDTVNFSIASIHDVVEVTQATYAANGNTQLAGGFSTPFGGGYVFTAQLTAGTHWYVCQPHASLGMKGRIIVQTATGIVENLLQKNISVYPNPATSEVTLNFEQAVHGTLQLSSTVGEVLEQTQINSASFTLDLGDKPKGVYFIIVADETGNKAMRKLVKM